MQLMWGDVQRDGYSLKIILYFWGISQYMVCFTIFLLMLKLANMIKYCDIFDINTDINTATIFSGLLS